MSSLNPTPNWSDPAILSAIEQAFDMTWPMLAAHETALDKPRTAELSMALNHKLIELAADGVIDPHELRRLALESFSLTPLA